MPSQALASAKEGVESRRRAPTAYKATVKACSRPRTRAGVLLGAAKAEVAGKSAALKSVSVRLRPRAPSMAGGCGARSDDDAGAIEQEPWSISVDDQGRQPPCEHDDKQQGYDVHARVLETLRVSSAWEDALTRHADSVPQPTRRRLRESGLIRTLSRAGDHGRIAGRRDQIPIVHCSPRAIGLVWDLSAPHIGSVT
jgi:hypothetical protein